jgi:hypothetical protein
MRWRLQKCDFAVIGEELNGQYYEQPKGVRHELQIALGQAPGFSSIRFVERSPFAGPPEERASEELEALVPGSRDACLSFAKESFTAGHRATAILTASDYPVASASPNG